MYVPIQAVHMLRITNERHKLWLCSWLVASYIVTYICMEISLIVCMYIATYIIIYEFICFYFMYYRCVNQSYIIVLNMVMPQ